MFNPRFPSTMPLAELVNDHFVPARKRFKMTDCEQGRVHNLRAFVRRLTAFLHRTPTVADLSPETLAAWEAWRAEFNPRWSSARANVPALVEFAQRPLPDEPPTDDGTLYSICEKQYFPRALRVRNPKTKRAYLRCILDFRAALGHEPRPADVTDEGLVQMAVWMQQQRKPNGKPRFAASVINERVGRIRTLAGFLFRKRLIDEMPESVTLPEPRRNPRAWRPDDLPLLLASCRQEAGEIVPGIAAATWWESLNLAIYDCGERIGAMLAAEWEHYDPTAGLLVLPAAVRKGGAADKVHCLHPETAAMLDRMQAAGASSLVWPWPRDIGTLYNRYARILERAGLPHDRGSKFHRMRRTTGTLLHMAGIDAPMVLGHDRRVFEESYLDRTQIAGQRPCDLLPRPAGEPLKLEYRPAEVPSELEWI